MDCWTSDSVTVLMFFVKLQMQAKCPGHHVPLRQMHEICQREAKVVAGMPFADGRRILLNKAENIAVVLCSS